MVTHFSVDTSVNIPATVNDFIKHLSEGFGVSDVYLCGDIDEVRQFILSHLHMVRGIKDVDGERQEGFLKIQLMNLLSISASLLYPI